MKSTELLKSALKFSTASLILGAVGLSSTTAIAQDTATETEDELFEEVVVTGSRIRRSNIDTVEPAIVLGRDLLDKRAFSNVADLLNETASFGTPDASPIAGQNSFSVGQNFVDFLGLGSQRTLTLVNGRRYVSSNVPTTFGESGGLQVDFNTIPSALVERIETIATGGAPTYGSDAIAGTINVHLRDDFEGFEVLGRFGVTDFGDADTYQLQTVIGGNFADDRGNVTIAVEYNRQQGLARQARPMFSTSRNQPYLVETDSSTVDGEDVGVWELYEDQRVALFTAGGVVSASDFFLPSIGAGALGDGNFYQFDPSGNLVLFDPGEYVGGSRFFHSGGDGVDLFDVATQIRSPLERLVISGYSHYDLTDNITAFAEFTFANTEARELSNQAGFQTFVFGGDSGAVEASVSNPLLSDQARGVLLDNGFGPDDTFFVSRLNNDLLNRGEDASENFLWRVVGGLEGDIEIGDKSFFWETYVNYGQSDVDQSGSAIIDPRFINALDAIELTEDDLQSLVDGGFAADLNAASDLIAARSGTGSGNVGDIICRSVLQAELGEILPATGSGLVDESLPFVDGCVPLNIFGEGVASPEALAWATGQSRFATDIEQATFAFNFGGDLIELPGGPIGFAAGYEHREESANFAPSIFDEIGLGRGSAIAPTGGSFKTNEVYGELSIPVISPDMDIPMLHSFVIEPKARYVDNSISGGDTTYTIGGRIAPVKDIQFRGNFTHSIRSPSLVELFQPQVQSYSTATDPCDFREVDGGLNPATRRANCIADGIDPDTFVSNVINATATGVTGGNPNLTNEAADSWTVGAVIQPRWVEGLTLTVDYINIKLKDRITSLSLTQTLEACYDNTGFPQSVCSNFTRDAGGQIVDFQTGEANAAISRTELVSFDLNYGFDVASAAGLFNKGWADRDFGTMDLRLNGVRRIRNELTVIEGDFDDTTGQFGENRWAATFDVNYNRGPLNVFWRIAWSDNALWDPEDGDLLRDQDGNLVAGTGDRWVHNMSVSYEVLEGIVVRAAVNNVFDRRGNYLQRAAGDISSGVERLGRNFTFGLRASF